MTVKQLWDVSPQCFTMIKSVNGEFLDHVQDYHGSGEYSDYKVVRIVATKYPMYAHVLELDIRGGSANA